MRQTKAQTPQVEALDPMKQMKLLVNLASALPQGIPVDRLTDEQLLYWQKHRSELHKGIAALLLREIEPPLMSVTVPSLRVFPAADLFRVNLGARVPIAESECWPLGTKELEAFIEEDIPTIVLTESTDSGPDLEHALRGYLVLRPDVYPIYFGHIHTVLSWADQKRRYAFKFTWYRGSTQTVFASWKGKGWKVDLHVNPSGPGD